MTSSPSENHQNTFLIFPPSNYQLLMKNAATKLQYKMGVKVKDAIQDSCEQGGPVVFETDISEFVHFNNLGRSYIEKYYFIYSLE